MRLKFLGFVWTVVILLVEARRLYLFRFVAGATFDLFCLRALGSDSFHSLGTLVLDGLVHGVLYGDGVGEFRLCRRASSFLLDGRWLVLLLRRLVLLLGTGGGGALA